MDGDTEIKPTPKVSSEFKASPSRLEGEPQRKIPEYDLQEGLNVLLEDIKGKIEQSKNPLVVEVAGGSASGKTSAVASKIKEEYPEDSLILSLDDYYRGKTFMEAEAQKGNNLNWDQPEALNIELFRQHLEALKAGKSIEKPVYDMKTSEPITSEVVQPKRLIIVEGLFALNPAISDYGDVKVFVDIGMHGRILRRVLRDIDRTGQRPSDILKYFAEVVEPMHDKYIDSTKANAGIVIHNEYNPQVESLRSGLHEVQMKFKTNIDPQFLKNTGGQEIGKSVQVDTYYNPRDRNLIETGEMLRIREDGEKRILTYKGPDLGTSYRDRPKFEFEIDEDTESKFLPLYGNKIKVIRKTRTLYQLNGVEIGIDSVATNDGGENHFLGNFVEIRSQNGQDQNIPEVLSKLGLKLENGIKESYFEMEGTGSEEAESQRQPIEENIDASRIDVLTNRLMSCYGIPTDSLVAKKIEAYKVSGKQLAEKMIDYFGEGADKEEVNRIFSKISGACLPSMEDQKVVVYINKDHPYKEIPEEQILEHELVHALVKREDSKKNGGFQTFAPFTRKVDDVSTELLAIAEQNQCFNPKDLLKKIKNKEVTSPFGYHLQDLLEMLDVLSFDIKDFAQYYFMEIDQEAYQTNFSSLQSEIWRRKKEKGTLNEEDLDTYSVGYKSFFSESAAGNSISFDNF